MEFSVYTVSSRGFLNRTNFDIYKDNKLAFAASKNSFWKSFNWSMDNVKTNDYYELRSSNFWASHFIITKNNKEIAAIERETFKSSYAVNSIYGKHFVDVKSFGKIFSLSDSEQEIAKVSRRSMKSKDRLGIAIKNIIDEGYVILLFLLLDRMLELESST